MRKFPWFVLFLALCVAAARTTAQVLQVSTFAGQLSAGSSDGTGTAARFNQPIGLGLDAAGNLYVVDYGNTIIRKITPAGVTTTLAGTAGLTGHVDGTGSAARFFGVSGLAVDSAGNVFTSEAGAVIRKVTPSGVVTTFAGAYANAGSADGTGTAARFFDPEALVFDASDNLWVADTQNHTIRKITPAGVVTTIAGLAGNSGSTDGTGSAARFYQPEGLAVDGAGNVFVADTTNCTLRKITPAGVVTTVAGVAGQYGSLDGTGTAARLGQIRRLAIDPDGNIYAPDSANTLRKITPAGVVTTIAGQPGVTGSTDGPANAASFNGPFAIARSPAGKLYVADLFNNLIRTVTVTAAAPAFTSAAAATFSQGTAGSFLVSAAASPAATFSVIAGSLPAWATLDAATGVLAGTPPTTSGSPFTFTLQAANGVNPAATQSFTLTVNSSSLPVIVNHPVTQNAIAGQPATLFVTATSPLALTYQWRKAGVAVSGATLTSLTFSSALVADSGIYDVVVTNTSGSTTSASATLAVASDPVYAFTTIAGDHSYGTADGVGPAARFDYPVATACDGSGNVYVADSSNHTIRKITPAGVVTTLAGRPGVAGSQNGTGTSARFNSPYGVAADASGNVFVADSYNQMIRKITPEGVVTTLAGSSGSPGSADGTGTGARFSYPYNLTLDATGNVFVSDTTNQTIRKVTAAGVVTTVAGSPGLIGSADGTGAAARFNYPRGLVVDASGTIFVADAYNHTIRKITAAGVVTTFAGTVGVQGVVNGTGTAAQFNAPFGLAFDPSGNLFLIETSQTVRRITPSGVVSTFAGSTYQVGNTDGAGFTARFYNTNGIGSDSSGNLYVADSQNNSIRKITPGAIVSTLAGSSGYGSTDGTGNTARFNNPRGIAADSAGNVFVADTANQTLRKITSAGVVTTFAGVAGSFGSSDGTGSGARFGSPNGIVADAGGTLYVADTANYTVRKVTAGAAVTTLVGSPASAGTADGLGNGARFSYLNAVAVDGSGFVYVADAPNHTVRKIHPNRTVTTLAGLAGVPGTADGTGNGARFQNPGGVTVDAAGNVFVADTDNHTIRKITPAGVVTTFAGLAGSIGNANGTGTAARFFTPHGLAMDSYGNLFVADSNNCSIRRITPAGLVTTVGGTPTGGSSDGIGTAARFFVPNAVTVDPSGNLFVADSQNFSIRKGSLVFAPLIATQPLGQTVALGGNAVFSVGLAASALPTTYQWRKNGVDIAGATGTQFALSNLTVTDAASYTVLVSNAVGTASSAAAVLTVDVPLAFTTPPVHTAVTSGQAATFTAVAAGNGTLTYQWRRGGFAIAGATTASYTIATARRSDADFYDVVVTSSSGSLASPTAVLSVAPTSLPDVLVPEPALAPRLESTDLASFNTWLELPDGRLLVGGNFSAIGATPRAFLARLTSAGALDTSYVPPVLDGPVHVLVRQSDGGILVGGQFTGQLLRLTAAGALDATFSVGQGFDNVGGLTSSAGVRALAVQSDGKIVVGGNFARFQGTAHPYLVRLTASGSLDAGFTPASVVTAGGELVRGVVRSVYVQTDGRIVVGGSFAKRVARLTSAGALDATFDTNLGSGFDSTVFVVRGTGGGKLWVAGQFSTLNGSARAGVARLNADGSPDAFAVSGLLGGFVLHLAEQSDGRVIVGGDFLKPTRLGLDGVVDPTTLFPATPFGSTAALLPRADGSIFVGVSLNASGIADAGYKPAFYSLTGAASTALTSVGARAPGTAVQVVAASAGKHYVVGNFTHVNGTARESVVRLSADFSLDPSFDAGAIGRVSTIAIQGDGRIVANGDALQRLNADGSLDSSYAPGSAAVADSVKLDPSGRAVIARYRVSSGHFFVERLTSTGALDAAFASVDTGVQPATPFALSPDGKVLIGRGNSNILNGVTFGGLARLTTAGTLDPTFTFSATAPNDQPIDGAIVALPDGRILGGRAGVTSNVPSLARFNADGSLDSSFNAFFAGRPNSMPPTSVIVPLPDGRVVRGGSDESVAGVAFSRHAANGTRDTAFQALTPADTRVSSLVVTDDGRFVAATRGGLLVLVPGVVPTISTPPANVYAATGATATLSVTATGGGLSYQWSFNAAPIPGATASTLTLANLTSAAGGNYTVTVTNPLGSVTSAPAVVSTETSITAPLASRSVGRGGATVFALGVNGASPLTYQWRKNGGDIPGATLASYTLPVVNAADAGSYTVSVRSPSGDLVSAPGTLTVLPNPLSYSARLLVGQAGVTAHFSLEGSTPKHVLLRALGPALTGLGVSNALADPQLVLRDANGAIVATNDDWEAFTGADLPALFNQVGAVALAAGSKDAALYATLAPGAYTLTAAGAGGTGVALLELFDTDTNAGTATRIAYFSARGRVDAALGGIVAGFGPASPADKRVLVRAIGPTLGGATALANPRLHVLESASLFAANDDWGGGAALVTAHAQAGAFPLPATSADAALLLSARLGAAAYVAQIPANSASGDALLEFYDLNGNGTPTFAPLVVVPPRSQSVLAGAPVTLRALVAGGGPFAYQWRKNGAALTNATGPTYTLSSAQPSDAGTYDVVVTAAPFSATSAPALVSVVQNPAGYSATHAPVGSGYLPGGTVTITNTLTYTGAASSLGWSVVLPPGWSLAAQGGAVGDVKPATGATAMIGWAWTTPPSSPVTFTYTLNVPAGEIDPATLAATAEVRDGVTSPVLLTPYPGALIVVPVTTHGADTDRNSHFSLVELTRVIELYNTRSGTTRTGRYRVLVGSEDGFASDAATAPAAVVALARYHSVDADRDGKLSLFELTRMIELYNTRSGTIRTGAYHPQPGTEDGFAPGP